MTNEFVKAMERNVAWKKTENGQDALNTSFNACLDLFATIGAVRSRATEDIVELFDRAYGEDALTAMKILFYARDIQEGLGERNTFKLILRYLGNEHTTDVVANLDNIAKFGRYDDLYCLVGTLAENYVVAYIRNQLVEDLTNMDSHKPISLLGKWLKSVNTSSKASSKLGYWTARALCLSPAEYRKMLAALRSYINLTESYMSEGKWDLIDFTAVPGGAMKKYHKAFWRHQPSRYEDYLQALKNNDTVQVKTADGKVVEKAAKINTKHLFPYEIIEKYWHERNGVNPSYEAMWKGLEDYLDGKEMNAIVVADTSGSMLGRPIATSVGLAIYFAERNHGPFHNKFMTFSHYPAWVNLPEGSSLATKINVAAKADWMNDTNLEAAFDLILNTAVQNHLAQEDLPKSLIIVTDMEFNECASVNDVYRYGYGRDAAKTMTFYDQMKRKYASYGYELPEIIFWNVNARHNTFHATSNVPHVRMVSGQAASGFKDLMNIVATTPYEHMMKVLSKERYNCIKIA